MTGCRITGSLLASWFLGLGMAAAQDPFPDAASPGVAVADPPTPVVRIQLRVPANIAPGKDIPYKILVSNTSAATAYRVRVRNPIPPGVASIVKVDPAVENIPLVSTAQGAVPKELTWDLGKLNAGEKREIDLVLRPTPNAKEIRNQAFVSFEHGQTVETRVDKPRLTVRKMAPKQVVQSEPLLVRVEVTNTGRVSIPNVELVEDVSKGFEFARDVDGERGASAQQRLWKIGTLRAGERKVVEYRLVVQDIGTSLDLLTTSVVRSPDAPEGDRAETTTKVVASGVSIELTGPTAMGTNERADYEILIRNTGGVPLSNLRVTGVFPADCTLARVTNNSQRDREQVSWIAPPLKPSESFTFRFSLKTLASGKKTIRATVSDGRLLEKGREMVTQFQGSALPQLTARLEPATLRTEQEGILTLIVSNRGTEPAKNVRVWVALPPEVRLVQATPRNTTGPQEVAFDALTIRANSEEKYTLTYKAIRSGEAWFDLKLTADALGEQPVTKKQTVTINP